MRALLLAAGKATRLGELSREVPKCLQQICGETLLDRLIRQLTAVGVEEFLINTHYLADRVAEHVARARWNELTQVVYERELLGTLGTLRRNTEFFRDEPGWVLHADNFMTGSLTPALDAFLSRPSRVWGSMLTFEVDDPGAYGVVTLDDSSTVESFFEKQFNAPSRTASAATFLFDHRVFRMAERLPETCRDISTDLLPRLVGRLVAAQASGLVIDIGTPAGLSRAQQVARHAQQL